MARNDDAQHFIKMQTYMVALLQGLYEQAQRVEADMTPHDWQGRYVNLYGPQMVLPRNARRHKTFVYNDGPSDLFIGPEAFDIDSVQSEYNESNNGILNVTIVRSGGNVELESCGAIYACPVNYGETSNPNCEVRITSSSYKDRMPSPPLFRLGPDLDKDDKSGEEWPESFTESNTNPPIL